MAVPCAAEVQVSLPLEGYYRAGRYMPVRVVVRGETAGELTLSADGAVPTIVRLSGHDANAIVPLLVVREPLGPLGWTLPDGRTGQLQARLIALGEQDRLVGTSGTNANDAAVLFRDKTIVSVSLDLADPIPDPAMAWEAR